MKDIIGLMKKANEMQGKIKAMQEQLAQVTIKGSSGGGLVEVTLSGTSQVQHVEIAPSLMSEDQKTILEDLIMAAFNNAKEELEKVMAEEMGKATGGLSLPGGFNPFG